MSDWIREIINKIESIERRLEEVETKIDLGPEHPGNTIYDRLEDLQSRLEKVEEEIGLEHTEGFS